MLSHVVVDLADPAFERPTKPIGPFFSKTEATVLAEARGWDIAEDAGRGYRRVVASPTPHGFVEVEAVRCLLEAGHVVVAGGGGGIPVGRRGEDWDGVDAVIDKDYAAAELAHQLDADALVLVTGVDAVMLDFGKDTQRRLTRIDTAEAERHLADGQFPEGSMGPKVRAATRFVGQGGHIAVITTSQLAAATLSNTEPHRRVGRHPDRAGGDRAPGGQHVIVSIKFFRDTYVDSVIQLGAMRAMGGIDGVDWASAAMATPSNVDTLRAEGVDPNEITNTGSNDFFVVVRATNDDAAMAALAAGEAAVFSARPRGDVDADADHVEPALLTHEGEELVLGHLDRRGVRGSDRRRRQRGVKLHRRPLGVRRPRSGGDSRRR